MPREIQPFDDSPALRRRAAAFLARTFADQGAESESLWIQRMAHWWDANPARDQHPARGWWMGSREEMTAFVGVIPIAYRLGAQDVTGLVGTSWAMEKASRGSCISMAMCLQRLGSDSVLIATTPSREVRSMLEKGGWRAVSHQERLILPGWTPLRRLFLGSGKMPAMAGRLVCDLADFRSVEVAPLKESVLERAISLPFLRWYLDSPAREHHFVGRVGGDGVLTDYLLLASSSVQGRPAWEVVESHSATGDSEVVLGLLDHLLGRLPTRRWLVLNRLEGSGEDWSGVRAVRRSFPEKTFYCRSPRSLEVKSKRWRMAEGDLGL